MTIILTGLVGDHIVQVSDRRLTWPEGKLYDDDTNKAVFFCGVSQWLLRDSIKWRVSPQRSGLDRV
jgi:hypothetical protein